MTCVRHARCLSLILTLVTASSAGATIYDFNASGVFDSFSPTGAFDGPWTYGATAGVGGSGGWFTNGQNLSNGHSNTTNLTSPGQLVAIPGLLTLSFDHSYNFEFDGTPWEGGAVFVSINGDAYTQLSGAAFTSNGYNGAVQPNFYGGASELLGQPAFIGSSSGFVTSVATLGFFGVFESFQIQFVAAYDENTSPEGADWVIDNVSIQEGGVAAPVIPEPSTLTLLGFGAIGLGIRARRRAAA